MPTQATDCTTAQCSPMEIIRAATSKMREAAFMVGSEAVTGAQGNLFLREQRPPLQTNHVPGVYGNLSSSFSVQESVRRDSFSRTSLRNSGVMGSAPCSHSRRI
jgi:hypothetical protein